MPDFIPPQLATLQDKPPDGDQWFNELKFDGYRMLCHLNRGAVRFWSRNKKDWTHKFPRLGKAVKDFPASSAILDGEVVAVDSQGRASFQKLQQAMKTGDSGFVFHIFDVIYLDGFNLARTPLRERKNVLVKLFESVESKGPLRYRIASRKRSRFFAKRASTELKGSFLSSDSVYESTRSHSWIKVKCIKRQEFVIAGFTLSDKDFPGFGALILGIYDKGKLVYAGRAGTGFSIQQRLDLRKKLDGLVRPTSPFAEKPKDPRLKRAVWVKPQLVGEVAFTEWTDDGSFATHPFRV